MSDWLAGLPALWQQIHWRWPWAVLIAALPFLLAYFNRRIRQRALTYADPHLHPWAIGTLQLSRIQTLRFWLETGGWALLALALAGPRWQSVQDSSESGVLQTRRGAHVTVIVQVSDSMRATDVVPDRLTRARLALLDGLDRLQGERLSLIAYGASAGVLLPSTSDHQLFAEALQWLDDDLMPSSGSNLAHALALALRQAARDANQPHAVLLVTDADAESLQDAGGEAVRAAVDALRSKGVPLYVWFAAPRSPSPAPEDSPDPAMPSFGGTDMTPDPEAYRQLSSATGGGTAYLAESGFGWDAIYTRGIGARPAAPAASDPSRGWEELFAWPLGLGIVLLGFAYTPGPARRPRIFSSSASASGRAPASAKWLVAIAVLLAAQFSTDATAEAMRRDELERKAWQAYNAKQWGTARQLYEQAGGYRGHWGAGLSALNARNAADAAQQLGLAWLLAPDEDKRLDTLYNLAHAHAALGQWDAAAQAWRTVAERRPADTRAAVNLKVALGELERQRRLTDSAQDLRGRRGKAVEGLIEPYGGGNPDDEPQSPDAAAGTGAANLPGDSQPPPAAGGSGLPPFTPSESHMLSGQTKIDRLSEQKTALRKALLGQDAGVPPLRAAEHTAKGAAR